LRLLSLGLQRTKSDVRTVSLGSKFFAALRAAHFGEAGELLVFDGNDVGALGVGKDEVIAVAGPLVHALAHGFKVLH
jgi:hypothetical protein